MFLRYAFFDHLKLRQMVEKGLSPLDVLIGWLEAASVGSEKRKAELAVGQNEMEPKIKSLKTTHGELLSNVNNNDNLSDDQVNNNPVQISPAEGIQDAGGGDPEKTCH